MGKSNFELDIFQQPEVIRRLVKENAQPIEELTRQLRAQNPRFVLIAARGTSDNAATYAKYLLGALAGLPVGLAMPSLYTLYKQPPDMRGGLVVGISQSGQTPDVRAVLEEARRQGVPTISISNDADSPMARIADHSIFLNAGEERTVPASKTFIAQMVAAAMIAAYWKGEQRLLDDLNRLGDLAEEALSQNKSAAAAAQKFGAKDYLVAVGRGFNHCTTFEIALKIKELSYMVAQAYSAADFRHGPIAMLEEGFPCVAIVPRGAALEDMIGMVAEIRQTKASLAVISNVEELLKQAEFPIQLPGDLPEWLSPVIATIPGQLLALHLALVKGYNPDAPRGLKKVTLTL